MYDEQEKLDETKSRTQILYRPYMDKGQNCEGVGGGSGAALLGAGKCQHSDGLAENRMPITKAFGACGMDGGGVIVLHLTLWPISATQSSSYVLLVRKKE